MGVSIFPEVSFLPGMVMPYAGPTAPEGWLVCDGSSRLTADYPALFAVIGYTYGGSGASFNLPNLKGRVIAGVDTAQAEFDVLGETGGSKTSTAAHTHTLAAHTHTYAHTHGMNAVDTNHAHNVYARNGNTSTTGHWHTARHPRVVYTTANVTHSHNYGANWIAEGPAGGARGADATIDVDNADHSHTLNHDHPSTNYQSESPWAGTWSHGHTTNSQSASTSAGPSNDTSGASSAGAASGNLPPYIALNYLIKT